MISYQHIFWFYSHPAVYIMMLPGFGIVSEVISTNSRKPIFGYRLMALALIGDRRPQLLGLGAPHVRLRHVQLAAGADDADLRPDRRADRDQDLLLAGDALPRGDPCRNDAMLFALGFIVELHRSAGSRGVMPAMVPIDIHVSDTYFIVAHIHFVLFAGSVFTIFAGIYHWFPKITGRMYDEKLGRVHFWLTLVGTWGTFVPMHWIGMQGMPRRVADYAATFGDWNLFISCCAFLLGAAQLIFLYNMIVSWRYGPKAGPNPWRAQDDRVAGLLAAAEFQLR